MGKAEKEAFPAHWKPDSVSSFSPHNVLMRKIGLPLYYTRRNLDSWRVSVSLRPGFELSLADSIAFNSARLPMCYDRAHSMGQSSKAVC